MSSSWDEFLPSKIRTLGVLVGSCTKIDHDTLLGSILRKKRIFDDFRFLDCEFVDFNGRILIYPAEYGPIGYIFGKYTLITPSHSKWCR